METLVQNMVNPIIAAMTPKLKEAALQASEAAKPAIKEVVREEIVPKVGLAIVLGFVGLAVVSSAVGSYFATRRNPGRRSYSMGVRRRAA